MKPQDSKKLKVIVMLAVVLAVFSFEGRSAVIFTMGYTDATCGKSSGELWVSSVDASTGSGAVSTWKWRYTTDKNWLTNISNWISITTKVSLLSAGSYYVEVEDGSGNRTKAQSAIILEALPANIIFTMDFKNLPCSDGAGELWVSSVDASSGSGAVSTWQWHYTTDKSWKTNISPWYPVTTKATTLAPGTYYTEIADGAGCRTVNSKTVTLIAPKPIAFSMGYANASCLNNDGELWIASVDASSGSGAVSTWRWHYTTDVTWATKVSPWYNLTTKVTNLPTGTYYIEVEDANNCAMLAKAPVKIESQKLIFTMNHKNITCGNSDGELWIESLDASSGKGSVSNWFWRYTTDPSWKTNISMWLSTPAKVIILSADSYYIEMKDANGCITREPNPVVIAPDTISIEYSMDHNDTNPGERTGSFWIKDVNVHSGSGSALSTWQWQYSTDPQWNNDISPWYSVYTKVDGVVGGSYYVILKDGSGCMSEIKTVVVAENPTFSLFEDLAATSCTVFLNQNNDVVFQFQTHDNANVKIEIFDLRGNLAGNAFYGKVQGGIRNEAVFSSIDIKSGICFYRLSIDNKEVSNGKILLIR